MSDKKELEPKAESNDTKSRFSHKTKIIVVAVITTVLLLAALVSLSVFFTLRKTTSSRLVDVKLDEGETLTYRVDQDIEAQVGETQKGMFVDPAIVFLFVNILSEPGLKGGNFPWQVFDNFDLLTGYVYGDKFLVNLFKNWNPCF